MESSSKSGGAPSIVASAGFWIGIFVVTVVLGFLCNMFDSEEKTQQPVEAQPKKKKNKKQKQKKEEVKEVISDSIESESSLELEPVAPVKKGKGKKVEPVKVAAPVVVKKVATKSAKEDKKNAAKVVEPVKVEEKIPEPVKKVAAPLNKLGSDDDSDSGLEWNDVKAKKIFHQPKPQNQGFDNANGSSFGGMSSKGYLVAGAVQQSGNRFGGSNAWSAGQGGSKPKHEQVNHASQVADYDFGIGRDDRQAKFETYSHVCSSSVAHARMEARMSQHQLATKINEKPSAIAELENGSGRYNAELINRIEHALKVQIPRGRSGKQSGKK